MQVQPHLRLAGGNAVLGGPKRAGRGGGGAGQLQAVVGGESVDLLGGGHLA